MLITCRSIAHNKQRYETCGDWQFDTVGHLHVKVSKLGNEDQEFLVVIHEMIEAWLARRNGVKEIDVDNFDMIYEANRTPDDYSEPGDDPRCPVYAEHQVASTVERMLALFMGVNWQAYTDSINQLGEDNVNETTAR